MYSCWLEATLRFHGLPRVPRGHLLFLATPASPTWPLTSLRPQVDLLSMFSEAIGGKEKDHTDFSRWKTNLGVWLQKWLNGFSVVYKLR